MTTIDKIRERVATLRGEGVQCWFRGETRCDRPLRSTLHRWVNENAELLEPQASETRYSELFTAIEKTIYLRTMARAWPYLSEHERSDWGLVFTLQHYGIPTRLLDWTESLACALFFALRKRHAGCSPIIYILNPERLNERNFGEAGLVALRMEPLDGSVNSDYYHPKFSDPKQHLGTIAVSPVYFNRRMHAQRATFTLCGSEREALDTLYPDAIDRYTIAEEELDEVSDYLALNAIGPLSFFPDMDGVRDELMKELEHDRDLARSEATRQKI